MWLTAILLDSTAIDDIARTHPDCLHVATDQSSANFFCKGPESKCFGICRPHMVSVVSFPKQHFENLVGRTKTGLSGFGPQVA